MSKVKRSYYLPSKLIDTFDQEIEKCGFVREKVVAAAIQWFLSASPEDRHGMFERLDGFLRSRKKKK